MHVRKNIQVIFQNICEQLPRKLSKKILFNKTSTYLSEFRLICNYVDVTCTTLDAKNTPI